MGEGEGLGSEVNTGGSPSVPNSEDRGGGEKDERVEEEEDSLGPTPSSSDSDASWTSVSQGLPEQQQQRGRGTRGAQKKDARNGRWGSFRCTIVRGNTWEGFQMVCPVHSTPNTNRNLCSRQRVWQTRDGVPVDPQDQLDTILSLMQWCVVAGQAQFHAGPAGREDHMTYMKTKAEITSMLMSQEDIEGLRASHGFTDDEDYTPVSYTHLRAHET